MKIIRYFMLMLCGLMIFGVQAYALTITGPSPVTTDVENYDPGGDDGVYYAIDSDTDVFEIVGSEYDGDEKYGGDHWQGYTGPDGPVIGQNITQITGIGDFSYKADFNEENDGTTTTTNSNNLYDTSFYGSDPNDATITWEDGGSIAHGDAYLAVKDGNNDPVWYLFNLTSLSWDGQDTIELKDFWEGRGGAISHVSLWGRTKQVPEPAVMLLMGSGLAGIAAFGRRRRTKRNT